MITNWELIVSDKELNNSITNIDKPHTSSEVLSNLVELWVDNKALAEKLWQLINAKTLNNKWDVMDDNKTQLETLKLIMKMNWVKIDNSPNFNFFNITNDWKIKY